MHFSLLPAGRRQKKIFLQQFFGEKIRVYQCVIKTVGKEKEFCQNYCLNISSSAVHDVVSGIFSSLLLFFSSPTLAIVYSYVFAVVNMFKLPKFTSSQILHQINFPFFFLHFLFFCFLFFFYISFFCLSFAVY